MVLYPPMPIGCTSLYDRVTPLNGVNALMLPHLGLLLYTPSGAFVARIMDYWLRQIMSNSWVAPSFGISLRQSMRRDSMLELGALDPVVSEPSFPDACVDGSQVETAAFVQTGDPLLLIGGACGQCNQGNTAVADI